MNLRQTLLAAAIGALPMMMAAQAHAAGPFMMAAPVAQMSPQESAGLVAKLSAQHGKAGLNADHGFAVGTQHPGVAGTRISRAQHTFKGLRVFGSETVVVTDSAGAIVSESVSDRRAGLGNGAGNALDGRGNTQLDVNPTLNQIGAIDLVVKAVAPRGIHQTAPSAELLVWPVMKSVRVADALSKSESALNALDMENVVERYELAYLVKTRMTSANKPVFFDTVVSARDGRVLAQWSALQTVVGTGNSQYNGAVPINTTLSGTTYSMKDATRGVGGPYGGMAITNVNHGSSGGSVYTNTSNTWGDGQQYLAGGSTTNANGQTAAVNAMWGLMNTYDMLKNTLGWSSLDGNNTASYIGVHFKTAEDNAYYDDTCKCMYIGDGNTMFKNLGSIDVIGHEMGHGVTAATSNLVYTAESGGLNESSSDISGEAVEAYARAGGTGATIPNSGNDWMMGSEISKSGQPLRWMYKPSKDGTSPNAWSSTLKNLNVHYSSGPNNRMFYFLSQGSNATTTSDYYSSYLNKAPLAMTGIGTDKAYRIWFKALTTKFTSSTDYADARNKVLLAAEELYGATSKEATAVKRAYAAINVGLDVDEGTVVAGTERLLNGGFESGATSWTGSTATIGTFTGQSAFEGSKYAWLGGKGVSTSQSLSQSVAIPSTATAASLSFALHIDTAESGTTAYDKLVVTVKNTAGTVLGTLATYSNANAATGYQSRSFSLLAYKGQTVQISFAMTEDSSMQTSFVVDKVSVLAQ
ncbi:Zn-dependent metalloprotease [Janthinobacterium sp. CG_23.3]|uniref:M4 family metallopeptidase n=1 Tax=Janthinobacterium sp. CG_23.3 TaxID=3349634 RepID=UPI0038D3E4A3